MTPARPTYLDFNASGYAWKKDTDYRQHPEQYRVGKSEQGVFICQPYKDEIVKYWRFRTPEIARVSSDDIYALFKSYLKDGDFVGADMARKYLQMGYTRARRYANYKGGRKYDANDDYRQLERGTGEAVKAKAAAIFYEKWQTAEAEPQYALMKKQWKAEKG